MRQGFYEQMYMILMHQMSVHEIAGIMNLPKSDIQEVIERISRDLKQKI
jgi:hypothetical protein